MLSLVDKSVKYNCSQGADQREENQRVRQMSKKEQTKMFEVLSELIP